MMANYTASANQVACAMHGDKTVINTCCLLQESLEEWRAIRQLQDEAYNESLLIDAEKVSVE